MHSVSVFIDKEKPRTAAFITGIIIFFIIKIQSTIILPISPSGRDGRWTEGKFQQKTLSTWGRISRFQKGLAGKTSMTP